MQSFLVKTEFTQTPIYAELFLLGMVSNKKVSSEKCQFLSNILTVFHEGVIIFINAIAVQRSSCEVIFVTHSRFDYSYNLRETCVL